MCKGNMASTSLGALSRDDLLFSPPSRPSPTREEGVSTSASPRSAIFVGKDQFGQGGRELHDPAQRKRL
jgi:hypothetical protein